MSTAKSVWIWGITSALALGATASFAQGRAPAAGAKAPAVSSDMPVRDLSGTWMPERGGQGGFGAESMPSDGRHEEPPYTPLAIEKRKLYHPGNGVLQVLPPQINDPAVIFCDPQGMPRMDLYEFRALHIVHEKLKTYFLYQYEQVWRQIWSDGRDLPKDPEPRWMGYSVGRWEDDNTYVVLTNGVDDVTWLDKAGRPHSDQMVVEERFHRTGKDTMELTITIDDPVMYTAKWKPLDKFRMKLMPDTFEAIEMMCSVSEYMRYNKRMGWGNPTATNGIGMDNK
jgi:hypothetical protein